MYDVNAAQGPDERPDTSVVELLTAAPDLASASALVRAAARLADTPLAELEREAGTRGTCGRTDPEQRDRWWPGIDGGTRKTDPAGRARRSERAAAERACSGCPVLLPCLAASYRTDNGRAGIWGGLGAQDRLELRPVWEQQQRADLAAKHGVSGRTS